MRSLSMGVNAAVVASRASGTAIVTRGFNTEFNGYLTKLSEERERLSRLLRERLRDNPEYKGMRNSGTSLAWDYEAADVRMGGSGSAKWNAGQRDEILQNRPDVVNNSPKVRGGVRGAEGHHQKNVAAHPEHQADPDNIKFYKSKDDHLKDGHGGDWRNKQDGPFSDKDEMLKRTNRRRVVRNELKGIGIAVAIATGVAFTISFAITLANSGVSPDSVKYALAESAKGSVEAGFLAVAGYAAGRIGEVASLAVTGLIENLGITITAKISAMVSMGVVGAITLTVFSVYYFIKLKIQGLATNTALIQVGRQALFSLSIIAVSIAAHGIWGGPAGAIVSIGIGAVIMVYTIADTVHQRKFAEEVRVYTIDKCRPAFAM